MPDFETKDSGARAEYANGFVRDADDSKPDFGLLLVAGVPYEEQPLTMHAKLLTRGAKKYDPRNWERAFNDGTVPAESPEIERAKSSAFRHLMQFLSGELDEDHASAVKFNVDFVAMLRRREAAPQTRAGGLPLEDEDDPELCEWGCSGCDDSTCAMYREPEPTYQKCGAISRDANGLPALAEHPEDQASLDAPCGRAEGHESPHRDQSGFMWNDTKWCRARMELPGTVYHLVCKLPADHTEVGNPAHEWAGERPVSAPGCGPAPSWEACAERHRRLDGPGYAACIRLQGHAGEHDHRLGWVAR